MRINKVLKYGFNQRKEYLEYKKVCNGKSISYTDWYEGIAQKYDGYDSKKLWNFEKYLTLLIRNEQRVNEGVEFLSTVSKYVISLLFPFMAIIVSLAAYIDGISSDIIGRLYDNEIIKEQLLSRMDFLKQIYNIFCIVAYVVIGYIIVMTIIYLFKYVCQKREIFLSDYRECIIRLKESKE